MITYKIGDATVPGGTKIIAHVVNCKGYWGKGFVVALNHMWPGVRDAYMTYVHTSKGEELLGKVFYYQEELPHVCIANMFAQEDIAKRSNPSPLSYDALERCLDDVKDMANYLHASVHMPRIGTGLAGGDWSRIEPLINKYLKDVEVTVYTLGE